MLNKIIEQYCHIANKIAVFKLTSAYPEYEGSLSDYKYDFCKNETIAVTIASTYTISVNINIIYQYRLKILSIEQAAKFSVIKKDKKIKFDICQN